MCVTQRNAARTLMLLFLPGVVCGPFAVDYHQGHICAVKGSSVVFNCSFRYPGGTVQSVMWSHGEENIFDGPFIFDSGLRNNSPKFEYIGDKKHNCSLKIREVEHNDAGKHAFRFITNDDKWTGQSGSTLKVVDLDIELNHNRTMKEGESVTLTCVNSCDGHVSAAFVWFKNGKPVDEGAALYLSNVSHVNSGNYTCSLKRPATTSGIRHIDVEYAPKNTSVSIIPSMDVDADSITLICSSSANPPVETYTWFKTVDDGFLVVGPGAVFLPGDGGQYFCGVTNKHGSQNSSAVTLKAKAHRTSYTICMRDALVIASVAVLLVVITVIAIVRLHKKRTPAPNTDYEEDAQDAIYVNCPVFDDNQSEEDNVEGTLEIVYTTVNFNNERKSNTEQQTGSRDDEDDVIYSTVWSSHNSAVSPAQ